MNSWTVIVEEDAEGNAILPFPEEMLNSLSWLEGDDLDFQLSEDGTSAIIKNLTWELRKPS